MTTNDDGEQRRDRTAAAGERRRDATADESENRRAAAMADEMGTLEANNARLDEVIRLLTGDPKNKKNKGLIADLAGEKRGRRRSVALLAVSLFLDVALSITTVGLVISQHHSDQRFRRQTAAQQATQTYDASLAAYNNAANLWSTCNAGNDTRATIKASFDVIYTLFLQNPATTDATRQGIAAIEAAQAKVLNQRDCGPMPQRPVR